MYFQILEARAKKCEKFRWFFGICEDKIILFRDLLTFKKLQIEFGDLKKIGGL
jgi:hypothetical protein